MSNTTATATSNGFDELRWVIQIRQMLDEELENDDNGCDDIPVSIFSVPKSLMSTAPDSYNPQQIAVGPYHHWRPELYEMERYKLACAKRLQKQLEGDLKFRHLVEQLTEFEQRLRGYYHRFLDFNGETLAWMMAMDASFLLEFLQVYDIRDGKLLPQRSHFVDYAGRKSAHNAILRDLIMLENQIPLIVVRKVLEFRYSSRESANDDMLVSTLSGFCKELFPFKMVGGLLDVRVSDAHHLLDLLYDMIVPRNDRLQSETILVDDFEPPKDEGENEAPKNPNYVKKLLQVIWKLCSALNSAPARSIRRLFGFLLKLPWTMISRLPRFSIFAQQIESLFLHQGNESSGNENSGLQNKPPLVEEITIPSITQLSKSGVIFAPTTGGVSTISFDPKTVTLHLPVVSLDVNSEVVLRNLVAYEAASASGPLVFTRYTELMNGIIDTEEDARLLRESGIILNHLKSDQEVADVWNGMSKSIRLTKVPLLDKVIEDVNNYYNGRWNVRAGKFLKRYVFGSWQILTFLATVLLLLLMSLQAFCSVYDCNATFHIKTT